LRFLIDAQLPPALARWLGDKGFVAEHVADLHLESARDAEIWFLAESTGAVIVTKDEDFARLAVMNPNGPRVIWVRTGNSTKRALLAWMERAWPLIVEALDKEESVIEIAQHEASGAGR